MASFYKRGVFQWEAKVRRRGYPVQSRTFESKVEAQAWAIQVEAEMHRGSYVVRNPADQTSMRELIQRFTVEVSPSHKGHLKEVARMRHTAKCKVWETYVSNLKPAAIADWRDQRLKEVSPATVLREMGDLALVLNHAMKEWGIVLPVNPLKLVKRPKVSNARERRLKPADSVHELSKSEEQRLLEACTHRPGVHKACRVHWLKPMVELAIETAMRRGELLRLEWRVIPPKNHRGEK
jgi:integrase